jgi:PhoH-like ATPase
MKKIYVLDTSVCLSNANAVYSFGKEDVYLPLKVLEEIDKHKNRQDGVGQNARNVIKILDELRERGSLQEGVRLQKGKGLLRSVAYAPTDFPIDLDLAVPDHVIIATAYAVAKAQQDKKVIVVSRDINMRVICDSIGLGSESYDANQVISNSSELYSGFTELVVDDEFIDRLYKNESIYLGDKQCAGLFPHQYITLISNKNVNKTALARFLNKDTPLRKVPEFKGRNQIFGIEARNREQSFAMDLLMDPSVPVVTLVGKAGSGKTLTAIAAGMEQMINKGSYTRLIVSRPVQPMGRDIGFLPGTLEEKMMPWLSPIQDNLQFLLGNDKELLQEYMDRGQIEIEALTYIRGRSIAKAFMIIDEAQNLSAHELKTIVTRVGEDTKIILTGDIEQIDNVYVNDTSNGLAYAVEKFKDTVLAGHVSLLKGERSAVATLAAKIL